jgi:hypothetical protein
MTWTFGTMPIKRVTHSWDRLSQFPLWSFRVSPYSISIVEITKFVVDILQQWNALIMVSLHENGKFLTNGLKDLKSGTSPYQDLLLYIKCSRKWASVVGGYLLKRNLTSVNVSTFCFVVTHFDFWKESPIFLITSFSMKPCQP